MKTAYMYNKTGMNNYPINNTMYKVTSYIKSSNMKNNFHWLSINLLAFYHECPSLIG